MKTKRYFNQILKPYKNIIKEMTGNYTDIRVTIGEKFCCFCRDNYDLEIEIPVFEDIAGSKAFNEKMKKGKRGKSFLIDKNRVLVEVSAKLEDFSLKEQNKTLKSTSTQHNYCYFCTLLIKSIYRQIIFP